MNSLRSIILDAVLIILGLVAIVFGIWNAYLAVSHAGHTLFLVFATGVCSAIDVVFGVYAIVVAIKHLIKGK